MSKEKKCIVFQVKGMKDVQSDYIDADEADRLLQEEVLPKIGRIGVISAPGAVVRAPDVVSAQTRWAPSSFSIV